MFHSYFRFSTHFASLEPVFSPKQAGIPIINIEGCMIRYTKVGIYDEPNRCKNSI